MSKKKQTTPKCIDFGYSYRFLTLFLMVAVLMAADLLEGSDAKHLDGRSVTRVGNCYWVCSDTCDEYGMCFPECQTICR